MGLKEFDDKISKLDQKIIDVLSERMSVMADLAEFKKMNNIPLLDLKKDHENLNIIIKKAKKQGLDKEFVELLFKEINSESKRVQRSIH